MRAPLDYEADPEGFARAILRVPRAPVYEDEAELAQIRRADEAWEHLCVRGLVPEHWIDDSARIFLDAKGNTLPHPPTARACRAFADDVAGVQTAEALAAEVCARLASWGMPPAARVRWRVVDMHWQARPLSGATPFRDACDAAELALLERDVTPSRSELMEALVCSSNPSAKEARYDAARAAMWAQAVPLDRALAAKPDPFAPALSIWGLGYAFEAADPGGVTLVVQLL